MAFNDTYRLSAHAIIFDQQQRVLLLRQTYGDLAWGLPGGAVDPGETVVDTLRRECREELGCDVVVGALTGVYLHTKLNAHVLLFRCQLQDDAVIKLSGEHSDWKYCPRDELAKVQRQRIEDCLAYDGLLKTAMF